MTVSYLPQIGEGELPEPTSPKIAYIPRMEMANLAILQTNSPVFFRCLSYQWNRLHQNLHPQQWMVNTWLPLMITTREGTEFEELNQ